MYRIPLNRFKTFLNLVHFFLPTISNTIDMIDPYFFINKHRKSRSISWSPSKKLLGFVLSLGYATIICDFLTIYCVSNQSWRYCSSAIVCSRPQLTRSAPIIWCFVMFSYVLWILYYNVYIHINDHLKWAI